MLSIGVTSLFSVERNSMPCNSDYMEPTSTERELHRTAQLMAYALRKLGRAVPKRVRHAANDSYGNGTDLVPELCALLKSLPAKVRDKLVYNAHSREARDLADWLEEHEQADREREEDEKADKERVALLASAKKKLTKKELLALR